jgi:hypothetical protein
MWFILSVLVHIVLLGNFVHCATVITTVYAEFGQNLGTSIPKRIQYLLSRTNAEVRPYVYGVNLGDGSLVLSLGNASLSGKFLSTNDVGDQGFRVMTIPFDRATLVMSNGKPFVSKGKECAMNVDAVHFGAAVGAYAVLQELGFAFLDPMDPIIPNELILHKNISNMEDPFSSIRGCRIEARQATDLTEVLNGFDNSNLTKNPSEYDACRPGQWCGSWDNKYAALDGLFEWFVANRQNRIEVAFLASITGYKRQRRLQLVNALAHSYGILIGAEVSATSSELRSWIFAPASSLEMMSATNQQRVDWMFATGFDFLSTDFALFDFSKPSCKLVRSLSQIVRDRGKF